MRRDGPDIQGTSPNNTEAHNITACMKCGGNGLMERGGNDTALNGGDLDFSPVVAWFHDHATLPTEGLPPPLWS